MVSTTGTVTMADLPVPFTVTQWGIRCSVTAGLTGTRLFGIELKEIPSKTVSKGTITGPTGNDFALPAFTKIPQGNRVPISLSYAPANEFKGFSITPVMEFVQGSASTSIAYFVMPNADITLNGEFARMAEPAEWVIEDISDAAKFGTAGWFTDLANDTYGYWCINLENSYVNTTQSGPHWLAAPIGSGVAGSNFNAVQNNFPDGVTATKPYIIQIEPFTNAGIGRNLPVVMDISQKDTIRIMFRRSGTINNLQFGLFNGGTANRGSGATTTETDQTVPAHAGTGYWVAMPDNSNTTSIANSSWDYLDIQLSDFTGQGFNAALLTGYGIRVNGSPGTSDAIHSRPRFYLDNIRAIGPLF